MSGPELEENIPVLGVFDYIRVIRDRWLVGLAFGLLLSGMWTLYQMSQKAIYSSSVKMVVEVLDDKVVDIEQVVNEQDFMARSSRADSLLSQHLIKMESREFRDYVISKLTRLQVNDIVEPYQSAEMVAPSISGILANSVEIVIDKKALVYIISASHRTPKVAAFIANTYAQEWVRFLLNELGSSNDTAISFLGTKAKDLEFKIRLDEHALQEFRKLNRIVSIDASQQMAISQLQQYQAEQTRITVERLSLNATIDQVEAAGDDVDSLLKIPEVIGYGNVIQYKQQLDLARSNREQLAIELLDRHPRMIENNSLIREYVVLLGNEVDAAKRTLLSMVAKMNAHYESNNELIATCQSEVQRLEELAIEYDSRVRSLASNKSTLLRITDRLNDTQIASQLSNANMTVVDSAYIPSSPSSPDMKKTVLVAVALLMIGFVGLPVGINITDDKLKTSMDVEQYIQKPLLGEIFRFSRKQRERIDKLVRDGEDLVISDAFRSVYNSIKLGDKLRTDKKIQVVTSTIPEEGKTMFSMNYGSIVSQHGAKTLIIDCDLRRPRLGKYMGLNTDRGLVPWLNGDEPIPNGNLMGSSLGILQLDKNSFVLVAGQASNRSTELVESERFKNLLDRLSQEFDHIIIDTPPIGVFPDAMFLADYADEVIYISSVKRVSRRTVKYFVDQLDKTKSHVCGIVLNGRKAVKSNTYGYNYRYAKDYHREYTEKETKG